MKFPINSTDFFVNVGSTLANAIPPTNKNPSEYMTSNEVLFVVSSVTKNEIEKIIENLKESSRGWGELRPRIIKFIKQSIRIPLTHISNLSFLTGVFPAELKIANVVPIFKSGDETILPNYRPVSVLPVFFLKFWKDLCIIGPLELSMKMGYGINIISVFKKESPQVWSWWLWLIKLLKLWTRENASLVFFPTFPRLLTQLIIVNCYKNWNYMVYKISHSNGLKIIYQIEFSM